MDRAKAQRLLASKWVVGAAVLLAAIISLPALFQGLQGDDHLLRVFVLRVPPWKTWVSHPLALFTFYNGDTAQTAYSMDHGVAPWWTDPGLRISFFRPLSAATHWLDFSWFDGHPWLMHAHSIAWYLALVATAAWFYRGVIGATWVAGFAALAYAGDHTHGLVVSWIANRNAIIVAFFSILSVALYDRGRKNGSRVAVAASVVCLALGFAAGEAALGALCYLVAYAVFLDASPRGKLTSLLPHAAVFLSWAALYRYMGYGVYGSGLYIDPGRSPAGFARALLENVPLLLQTELGGFPPDILIFLPRYAGAVGWCATLVLLALVAVAARPIFRDPRARFFLAGAVGSAIPCAATFPAARLLLIPGLGTIGLVALFVESVLEGVHRSRPRVVRALATACAVWIGGGHLFVSPLTIQVSMIQWPILDRAIGRLNDALGDDPQLSEQRVVLVNGPDLLFNMYAAAQRTTHKRTVPWWTLLLASGTRDIDIERPDDKTLVVREESGFYREGLELLTRGRSSAMPRGTRVTLSGVTVDITATDQDGVPTEATFRFDRRLEDDHLRWLEWQDRDLVPFALPPVGQQVHIRGQRPNLI